MDGACLLLFPCVFQEIFDKRGNEQNDDDPDGNTH
jgi:hypothetical protein